MADLNKLRNIPLQEIMKIAFREHILVPAFNVAYLPMVEGIVAVLEEYQTFALLEVSRPDITRFGAESFRAVQKEYERWGNPALVRLHQDHVPVIDEEGKRVDWSSLIEEALDLGYHSVMIDGSRLPLEENVAITREVVARAHQKGMCVEAELGAVLGHEAGPLPPYEELFQTGKGFTDPGEARYFVAQTGVDWLSVAVGNIHGAISGVAKDEKKVEAKLNVEHLAKICELTGVPLVLHGGSGIQKQYVMQAIQNGITKINVGTEIRQTYEKGWRTNGSIQEGQKALQKKLREIIEEYYEIGGSALRLSEKV